MSVGCGPLALQPYPLTLRDGANGAEPVPKGDGTQSSNLVGPPHVGGRES